MKKRDKYKKDTICQQSTVIFSIITKKEKKSEMNNCTIIKSN